MGTATTPYVFLWRSQLVPQLLAIRAARSESCETGTWLCARQMLGANDTPNPPDALLLRTASRFDTGVWRPSLRLLEASGKQFDPTIVQHFLPLPRKEMPGVRRSDRRACGADRSAFPRISLVLWMMPPPFALSSLKFRLMRVWQVARYWQNCSLAVRNRRVRKKSS